MNSAQNEITRGQMCAMLRHASADITRLYVHSVPTDARQAVAKVEKGAAKSEWTQMDPSSQFQ